ncbi:MAG: hypothetical protein K0R57_1133 [Paenibacillaceae bacterium]|jgi:hypothetical protein|nr:hypothetical protein [Paenibacillaceae bacterium]
MTASRSEPDKVEAGTDGRDEADPGNDGLKLSA